MLTRTDGLRILAIGLMALVPAQSSPAADSMPKVTVRVYNYAHIRPNILARAEKDAAWVFREAGVETVWTDCSPVIEELPSCTGPLNPATLILRILERPKPSPLGLPQDALGYALPSTGNSKATYATVFFEPMVYLAQYTRFSQSEILGYAITHEIGHLLLAKMSHSSTGIMRAQWNREDLQHTTLARELFTPEQAERIRADLEARRRQDAPLPLLSASANPTLNPVSPPF